MKHLIKFETAAEYEAAKEGLEKPWVTLTEDNSKVWYSGAGSADAPAEDNGVVSYSVKNIEQSATEVEGDVTSITVNYVGVTTTTYQTREPEVVETALSETVTFEGNTTTEDVTREGSFEWNGVTVNWTVTVKGAVIIDEGDGDYEEVDLGLPSGLKWAKCNVGADEETDPGLYFMWGDTEGHAKDSGYGFSSANYSSKGLNTISTNLTLAQDAANANMGGSWRMPTKTEFEELYNNTNVTWTTINGVAGRKFANKTDASKYIFMPAAGLYNGSSFTYWGSRGYYWSSTLYDSSNAYCFCFYTTDQHPYGNIRFYGSSVRGVK